MGVDDYSGSKSTESNWSIAEDIFLTNGWDMNDGKTFYGNDGPDDIVTMTRTT